MYKLLLNLHFHLRLHPSRSRHRLLGYGGQDIVDQAVASPVSWCRVVILVYICLQLQEQGPVMDQSFLVYSTNPAGISSDDQSIKTTLKEQCHKQFICKKFCTSGVIFGKHFQDPNSQISLFKIDFSLSFHHSTDPKFDLKKNLILFRFQKGFVSL